jgi:hypothetical protein
MNALYLWITCNYWCRVNRVAELNLINYNAMPAAIRAFLVDVQAPPSALFSIGTGR